MKPLLEKDLSTLTKRFDNFVDAQLRSIEIIAPTVIKITLAAQDSVRGFDWVGVEFEFSGVSDAKLIDNSKLAYIDTGDGLTILHADKNFLFAVGDYKNPSSIKNSLCFVVSSSLKYAESSF